MKENHIEFYSDPKNREALRGVLGLGWKLNMYRDYSATLTFNQIYSVINKHDERELRALQRFMAIDPRDFGFKGPFLGLEPPPSNLVEVDQRYWRKSGNGNNLEEARGPHAHLPEPVFKDYQRMKEKVHKDLGKNLLIESGYRSPAYQLWTLISEVIESDFDLPKTFSLVAFPGYSEHGYPPRQAIDFLTEEGIGSGGTDERFAKTEEYTWLLQNAQRYGFVLSYPRGNPDGITFEPWHWSHRD